MLQQLQLSIDPPVTDDGWRVHTVKTWEVHVKGKRVYAFAQKQGVNRGYFGYTQHGVLVWDYPVAIPNFVHNLARRLVADA